MEGMELKPQFDELQKIFDRCIKHACRVLEERIATKTTRFAPDQRQEQERLEYNRIADELAELYLHRSVLSDLRFCYSEPAFLWEGGFFEALHADEKKNENASMTGISFLIIRFSNIKEIMIIPASANKIPLR